MNDEREKAWKDWGMPFDQMASEAVAKCGFYAGYNANEPKWTYCEDALPNEDGLYLVTLDSESVLIDRWDAVWGNWWQFSNSRVIAWQPLPAPAEPKEAK